MTAYNLSMGGLAGNSNNAIVPQNSPCLITGYADHQRLRAYAVTRQLDFRPRVPFGGIDTPVDQKDYCWYQDLLAQGRDVQVGDLLDLITIIPYSRVNYAMVRVVTPTPGLVMTIVSREICPSSPDAGGFNVQGDISDFAGNAIGETAGMWFSAFSVSDIDRVYRAIALEVTAIPASGPALNGFFLMAQAEIIDWGVYDFNGNA